MSRNSDKRSLKKARPSVRLLAWLLPVAACVVLIGLILAVPGLRRRVLVQTTPAPAPSEPQPEAVQQQQTAEETDLEVPEPPQPSLESSEPGLEVLPPLAAQTLGRRVPKQLLVGRRAGMFASVEDAVAVAIPGDVIEIRTNQPMLVGGAAVRVKERVENAPLTIRAGKGYQPILRVAADVSFLTVVNVDLKLVGIHLVTGVGPTWSNPDIKAESSNVTLERCSLTGRPMTGSGVVLSITNPKGIDNKLRVSVNHCFVRGYPSSPVVAMAGPSVSVTLDESVFLRELGVFCSPAENQSIYVRQCTVLDNVFLAMHVGGKKLTSPLSFRMDRSIFTGDPGGGACLFEFHALPGVNLAGINETIRRAFREFSARDNAAHFRGSWGCGPPGGISEALVGELPQDDQTIAFGSRVEAIREARSKGIANALDACYTLVPQDLTPSSTGFLGLRMSQGIRYGADLNQLPVPPLATLAPFHADYLTIAEAVKPKVRLQSDSFPLTHQDLSQLPNWGPGERQLLGAATKPGQWADLLVAVPQAGKWSVRARLTRGPTSGIVKVTLNGEPAGKEVDLFAPETSSLPAVDLGEHTLPRGEVNLRIETVGSSPNAPKPGFHFGIERVVLRRVVGKK